MNLRKQASSSSTGLYGLGLVLLFWATAALGQPVEKTLQNGLRVIVKADHRAPVVVSQIWYHVGSVDEPKGITGVSHVLEHMMFKGTVSHPGIEFSTKVAENGGEENAATSHDYTFYYQEITQDKLPMLFEMESDRMQNLSLPADEFEKEMEVVKEERRMRVDNQPQGMAMERFFAAAFLNTPYHQPIIGWPDDLSNMTVEDVKHWYQQWYVPNNATLVVVGDVEPKTVFALAEKYFAQIPSRALPERKPVEEVQPLGERSLAVHVPATLPWMMRGYNTPKFEMTDDNLEPLALVVLSELLGGSDVARLSKALVRQKELLSYVRVSYDPYSRYDWFLSITAVPAKGVAQDKVDRALDQQIEKAQKELFTQKEIKRVIRQIRASEVFSKDSMESQAQQLGWLASLDYPLDQVEKNLARLDRITPELIRDVAQKYLVKKRMTSVVLVPETISESAVNP